MPPDELAARYGIDVERPIAEPAGLPPDVLAAIEDAVARGVARGLREALGERRDECRASETPAVVEVEDPAIDPE